jgi:succinate dehydrogenase / fumarate reductase cytochrome b subunit
MWAYVLNRLTGIGLVVYLYLHLVILSTLARGPEAWDSFVALAKSPPVLVFDVVLLVGLLIHSLNSTRLVLTSLGVGLRAHKPMFIGLMVVTAVLAVIGTYLIFTK